MIRFHHLEPYSRYSETGEVFTSYREEPSMPRIANKFLDCSVFLYPTEEAAKRGERSGGSGFLVAVAGFGDGWLLDGTPARKDFYHLYVVSTRHLIHSPKQDFVAKSIVRLNTHKGDSAVIPAQIDHWHCSPDHDLAVLPIPFREHYRFLAIGLESFLTEEVAGRYDVGIGDEVFMVGRFISHDGVQQNNPSVRWGHVSMMPAPVYHPTNTSCQQDSFLVEIHTVGGYSGSPVFVRPFQTQKLPVYTPLNTVVSTTEFPAGRREEVAAGPWLLGVEWGFITSHEQEKNNTGMSGVVPAWHLRSLLESEPLIARRRKDQEIERERERQAGSVETSSPDRSPPG
jgi:hypothetical protein